MANTTITPSAGSLSLTPQLARLPKDGMVITFSLPDGLNSKRYSNTPDLLDPPIPFLLTPNVVGKNVELQWTAQPDADTEVYGYRVFRNNVRVTAGVVDSTTLGYTDANLADNTYVYSVRSVDVYGNESDGSAEVTAIVSTTTTSFNPRFPRRALFAQSSPQSYDTTTFQTNAKKFDYLSIVHWNGWESGRAMSLQQALSNIKQGSLASAGTHCEIYTNSMEISESNQAVVQEWYNKVWSMGWWCHYDAAARAAGIRLQSDWAIQTGADTFQVNNTPQDPRAENNYGPVEWYMDWRTKQIFNGTPQSPAIPACDGVFLDNVFWRPRITADFNRDGFPDNPNDDQIALDLRTETAKAATFLLNTWPGKRIVGNMADLYNAVLANKSLVPFQDKFQGGLLEYAIGASFSYEEWGGWDTARRAYYHAMDLCRPPKLVVFWVTGYSYDYKLFRYGLCTSLLDDGYYVYMQNDSSPFDVGFQFHDEYTNDLGYPLQPRPTAAWRQGVWRRDYEKGIALVNPKGNGTQTVALDGSFKRITGTQDATTNNGATISSETMLERDGRVLLRL